MNAKEIRAELEKQRVNVWTRTCECCEGSQEVESDPDGEFVRWSAIEEILAYIEREQA